MMSPILRVGIPASRMVCRRNRETVQPVSASPGHSTCRSLSMAPTRKGKITQSDSLTAPRKQCPIFLSPRRGPDPRRRPRPLA